MVAVGGVLGAEVRYGVSMMIPVEGGFPWAMLMVNVTGCLLIGLLMVVILELTAPHRLVRPSTPSACSAATRPSQRTTRRRRPELRALPAAAG